MQNAATTFSSFDPKEFLPVLARCFGDLKIGDVFRAPRRALTDAHASASQAVPADNYPVYYDAVWAARHGHSAPVVHGLQVLAFTAPGATLLLTPSTRSSSRLRSLVRIPEGSSVGCQLVSGASDYVARRTGDDRARVTTAVSVFHQKSEMVLSGEHKYALKLS